MKRFLHGFIYAYHGIITCIKEERNFRFHMGVMFHLFAYLHFFEITRAELCILVMLCGLVFALEAVNTAIENAIDSTGIVSDTAGKAKDCAAGAVLITAIISMICGIAILWQPAAFAAILKFYIDMPIIIFLQIAVLAFWIWFVFIWSKNKKSDV